MSEMQNYYSNFSVATTWAEYSPLTCQCKGFGWALSDVDTWHLCPYHGKGVPHPDDCDDGHPFNYTEHLLGSYRREYARLRAVAKERTGWSNKAFEKACELYVKAYMKLADGPDDFLKAKAYVWAATQVVEYNLPSATSKKRAAPSIEQAARDFVESMEDVAYKHHGYSAEEYAAEYYADQF